MDCVFYVKGESKTFRPRIKEFKSFFPLLISLKPKWGFFSQKITFPLITIFNNIFTFHNFSIYFILLGRFRWKLTPLTFPMRMPMARRISAHSHSFSIETKRFFHEIETTLIFAPFFSKINREIEKVSTKAKGQQTSTPLSEYEGMP